mmetsp:Transcript_10131/g.28331  ORF Transcript_10131/g.28331 Transcript_10131/m.28331 type:complete len:366 (+) Transcript_10131:180-1277(+)
MTSYLAQQQHVPCVSPLKLSGIQMGDAAPRQGTVPSVLGGPFSFERIQLAGNLVQFADVPVSSTFAAQLMPGPAIQQPRIQSQFQKHDMADSVSQCRHDRGQRCDVASSSSASSRSRTPGLRGSGLPGDRTRRNPPSADRSGSTGTISAWEQLTFSGRRTSCRLRFERELFASSTLRRTHPRIWDAWRMRPRIFSFTCTPTSCRRREQRRLGTALARTSQKMVLYDVLKTESRRLMKEQPMRLKTFSSNCWHWRWVPEGSSCAKHGSWCCECVPGSDPSPVYSIPYRLHGSPLRTTLRCWKAPQPAGRSRGASESMSARGHLHQGVNIYPRHHRETPSPRFSSGVHQSSTTASVLLRCSLPRRVA